MAAVRAKFDKRKILIIASGIVLVAMMVLVISYVVVPVLSPFESAQIPTTCTASSSHLPASRNYLLPSGRNGTLLTSDAKTAVVVMADYGQVPFASTVHVIDRSSNKELTSLTFANDILAAAINGGALYLYNDKILFIVDTSSGASLHNLIQTDNYRGFYASNNIRFIQTSADFSSIRPDGQIMSHLQLHLATMAFGCLM